MSESDNDFEEYCKSIWENESKIISERFGTNPIIPEQFVLSNGQDVLEKYEMGRFIDGKLLVNSQLSHFDSLLPLIIAKFCLHSSLPSDLLCKEVIDDFSIEYARQRIEDEELRDYWEDLWSKHSPPRMISTVMGYNPSFGYTWLYSVAGKTGLETLVKELSQRAKNQIPISLEDYLLYFMMRVRDFENSIDMTELKIINHLLENPKVSVKKLSGITGISSEWISRKIGELKKRNILREFERMPFSRVGIDMFQVMLEKTDAEEDPFSLVKKCPFLFSFSRVVSGSWNSIITLCIPENVRSRELAIGGLQLVAEHGFNIDIHQIKSSGVSYCFDFYGSDIGQWDVPWGLLTVHLRRIGLDGLAAAIPRKDTPALRSNIPLDELDIKILDCVWRGFNSVSKIRTELKVGQHRVAESLKKLRESEILITSWEIHNIGLNEHVVVYETDAEKALTIAGWALRLPRSIISFAETGELLLTTELPKGGSYGLATSINEFSADTRVGVLGRKVYGTWRFPVTRWNHELQSWTCPESQLEEWISGLR
jgi:DNA-binding Lrp family transcriptional regulator